MLARLFLLIFSVTLIELWLIIGLYRLTGLWTTIATVIVTAALGSYLLRKQGMWVWRKFREELQRGQIPTDSILDGLFILTGGLLLLTPGLLTDLVGLALMVPGNRRFLRRYLKRRYAGRILTGVVPNSRPADLNRDTRASTGKE